MDTVTYPHEVVSSELAGHWLVTEVDVDDRKPVAEGFGVAGIPVAVAVRGDGTILGTVIGFVEPESFASQLADLRGLQ